MSGKKKIIVIVAASVAALLLILYLGGMLGQVLQNYAEWRENDGMAGKVQIKAVNPNPINCFQQAFSAEGLKSILGLLFISGAIFVIYKLHDKFDGKERDPRGFVKSRSGAYGTASWMTDKEMREVLEISEPGKAEGIILGEYKGKTVGLPKNTRLNRHIAVFGASGTGKSRAVIRNSLFQALKNNESVVITDPKGELYADTAEMYRRCGYEVKVYNLVNPGHSDSWNCMSDLCGDTLMAQVLTNVIIGNTSSGKGDHFWDNGEGNLLKALVLYIDQDPKRAPEDKHLPAVYQMLTQNNERQLTAMFERLPLNHPARAPYNLFAQSSDTVRSGIVLGLGTRLQVLQDRAVQAIAGRSDIDLTAPGKRKCAYYISFIDIYAQKYDGYYFDSLNLFDYFNEITIVGVFEYKNEHKGLECDVLLTEDVHNKLSADYYDLYFHTYYILNNENYSIDKIVAFCGDNNVLIDEPSISQIYNFQNTIQSFINVLKTVAIILVIIALFMLLSYVSNSISSNTRTIGILRSLGVRKRDTLNIFVVEAMFISLLSLVLSMVGLVAFAAYGNIEFSKTLVENPFNIIVINIPHLIVISSLTVLFTLSALSIPIMLLARKTPMQIINNQK